MVIINSFKHPESPIKYQQSNIRAILDKKDIGVGTVYISERTLCWNEKDNVGFSINYPDISLHAISRDPNLYDKDCLYVIVDKYFYLAGNNPPRPNDDDSDCESEPQISELILVPEDPQTLSLLYEAVKTCQELNGDAEDTDEDEDENIYMDAEDTEEGHYNIDESGGGDADVDDLSDRIAASNMDVIINLRNGSNATNGNAVDDEFEDAD